MLLLYRTTINDDINVLEALNELLLKFNHSVVLRSYKEIKTIDFSQYSLVLIYNYPLSKDTIKSIDKAFIPKVLIIKESKIFNSFINYATSYNKIIFLKDQAIRGVNYFPLALVEYLSYPFCVRREKIQDRKNERTNALVILNSNYSSELLIKIAPALNYFRNIYFTIVCKTSQTPEMFNNNTNFASWDNIDEKIEKSDFLIGNGSDVLNAILADKPAIVVGDNGYGGLVTSTKIESQYQNFFSGRIGGEIREHLPTKLLIDDIITIHKMKVEERQRLVEQNKNVINAEHSRLSVDLNNILKNVVHNFTEINNNLFNLQLKISNDFHFIPIVKDRFVVTRRHTNLLHSIIDKECYEIICQFRDGNNVLNVMKQTINEVNRKNFENFIIDLLIEHILEVK